MTVGPQVLLDLVQRNPDLAEMVSRYIIRKRIQGWEKFVDFRSRDCLPKFVEYELQNIISKQ